MYVCTSVIYYRGFSKSCAYQYSNLSDSELEIPLLFYEWIVINSFWIPIDSDYSEHVLFIYIVSFIRTFIPIIFSKSAFSLFVSIKKSSVNYWNIPK